MYGNKEEIMSKPARDTLITAILILTLGTAYYFVLKYTSFGIPCYFYKTTGYKCPACGISHMFMHMSHFQFKEALNDNHVMFFLWPFTFSELLYVRYLTSAKRDIPKWNKIFLYVAVGISAIYCIIRNTELF